MLKCGLFDLEYVTCGSQAWMLLSFRLRAATSCYSVTEAVAFRK